MINEILKVNTKCSLAVHGGLAEPRAAADGTEPRGWLVSWWFIVRDSIKSATGGI